jgi:hypothetical protein
MRDYSKVGPKFWIGTTGKRLKSAGLEAQVVAMYLMTSPHANMLGLFYQPLSFISHETGLTFEGASKGLQRAIEGGFCVYDADTEMVWVMEMAKYQIADHLKATDKQSKGVQNEYDALPGNPWLEPFFEKYGKAFCMTNKRKFEANPPRPSEAPSKPHRSQEQEQEQEQEHAQDQAQAQKPVPAPRKRASGPNQPDPLNVETWKAYKAAFLGRYGVAPVRNASVNSQIAQFVKRLGNEAPAVAAHYLASNQAFYVRSKHTVGPMLKDAEGLHTEWQTGNSVTHTQAMQADKTAANGNVFNKLIKEAEDRERIPA